MPSELENLKRRLAIETDPAVKAELQEAIEIRQRLLQNLQNIANSAKRTEIKLDSTVAQLSTVYAQLQLLDTRALDSGRAQRLRSEIQEEIASLSDTISAMDDVYRYGSADNTASSGVDTSRLADSADTSADSASGSSTTQRAGGRTRNG